MVTRPSPLLAIEGQWVYSGRDSEQCRPIRMLIRDLPCEAGTAVVADQMKRMANGGYDIERVADPSVHTATGVIYRFGPGNGRISPLVRRHGVIAGICHRMDRGGPEEPRHAEPVKHQHEWRLVVAFDRNIGYRLSVRSVYPSLGSPSRSTRSMIMPSPSLCYSIDDGVK
jgi:hypothetical protein